jgi:hypothetical protein
LFQFVTKQYCLFRFFRYRFETPKQTETNRNKPKFLFVISQNKPETDRFVLVRTGKFIFVRFEDTLPITALRMHHVGKLEPVGNVFMLRARQHGHQLELDPVLADELDQLGIRLSGHMEVDHFKASGRGGGIRLRHLIQDLLFVVL